MSAFTRATGWIDRELCTRLADGLAAAFAVALPWSTSVSTILSMLWLIVVIPSLEAATLRRVLATPAGGLPVLLFAMILAGMLWAFGVPMAERVDGLKSAYKFLFIPLVIAQFYRSERGGWVLTGFVASCGMLLALSWLTLLLPGYAASLLISSRGIPGVPVRDYIAQSGEFAVCIFLLAPIVLDAWRAGRRAVAAALALLCAGFVAGMLAIVTSRTALVVVPVLLLLFAVRYFSRKGTIILIAVALVLAALTGFLVPSVRNSVTGLWGEVRDYKPDAVGTRAGERIEFWKKSLDFVASAPLIGHGTGSIRDQFRRVVVSGHDTNESLESANPHNQTFAVAIQLGLVGTAVLFAMWFAHFMLFWREGFVAWAGLVIVTQNIVGSLFNSHLFDYAQGWGYVWGVGIAAGLLLKARRG